MHTTTITEVPAVIWDDMTEYCERMNLSGAFFPLSADDALMCAAEDVAKAIGRPLPNDASVRTYLTQAFRNALYRFHSRKVVPMREQYRAIERKILKIENSESSDETWLEDAIERGHEEAPMPMTMHELGENLGSKPSVRTRRDESRSRLCEICARLPYDVKRVFAAYIRADGDFDKMAGLLRVSRSTVYSRFNRALALARKEV